MRKRGRSNVRVYYRGECRVLRVPDTGHTVSSFRVLAYFVGGEGVSRFFISLRGFLKLFVFSYVLASLGLLGSIIVVIIIIILKFKFKSSKLKEKLNSLKCIIENLNNTFNKSNEIISNSYKRINIEKSDGMDNNETRNERMIRNAEACKAHFRENRLKNNILFWEKNFLTCLIVIALIFIICLNPEYFFKFLFSFWGSLIIYSIFIWIIFRSFFWDELS